VAFPSFAGKHLHDSVFTPEDAVAGITRAGGSPVPRGVVISYQRRLADHLRATGAELRSGFPGPWRSIWEVDRPGAEPVGVVNGFGIGAPAAAMVLEELIALGGERFINLGTAGCLQSGLEFGQVVLCTAAIRDEGLSHHYLPSAKFSYPSEQLSAELASALASRDVAFRSGPTWTTDAVFRETVAEARAYQTEGVVTVEMEAAALFAVAEVRGVQLASAFAVSDHVLPDTPWTNAFLSDAVHGSSVALLEAAIAVLGRPEAASPR
jgi:uridine phosphorylase